MAAADPAGRALFALVRSLVDELEEAAPWSLLYATPVDLPDLYSRAWCVLELVDQAPGRIALALDSVVSPGASSERAAREEAEFYFAALHQMTAPDRRLLGAALDKAPGGAPLSSAAGAYLAELTSDLKGKYSSAMMGAAAALVSDGRWLGVEVEAALFLEKAEEQAGNRSLLEALVAADGVLTQLRAEFPWRVTFESWNARRQVERYALSPLIALRPFLHALLAPANRRALFSGDYHLLQRRELLLGSRLRELEELHLSSLDLAADLPSTVTEVHFGRLCQLLLELAAVIDVEVLRELLGNDALIRLRRQGASAGVRLDEPQQPAPLAQLLREEDLTMFIRLLSGEVTKRSSIAREAGLATQAPSSVANGLARPAPTGDEHREQGRRPRLDSTATRHLETELAAMLSRLTSADYDRWRAFQMVHKLHARLRVLPPTLLAEIQPFLTVLKGDLLPLLEDASAAGLLPAASWETLRASSLRLSELDPSRLEHRLEVGNDLGRVVRLLESLTVAVQADRG